jgi:hypothetical protein
MALESPVSSSKVTILRTPPIFGFESETCYQGCSSIKVDDLSKINSTRPLPLYENKDLIRAIARNVLKVMGYIPGVGIGVALYRCYTYWNSDDFSVHAGRAFFEFCGVSFLTCVFLDIYYTSKMPTYGSPLQLTQKSPATNTES